MTIGICLTWHNTLWSDDELEQEKNKFQSHLMMQIIAIEMPGEVFT